MKIAACPSCGAPIDFALGAGRVKVCAHCNTVVLRGTARLEDLGRVADLSDTQSPLTLGLTGIYNRRPFSICGHIQKENDTGLWDEWCLHFEEDDSFAWLSQSEGEWHILVPLPVDNLPLMDSLPPGTVLRLSGRRYVVEERATAKTVSAEGQLPNFNKSHEYVDATGADGTFASLDAADGTTEAFVGHRTTLHELRIDEASLRPTPLREKLFDARCTECNGPLELKAPDSTKRVACPYCNALLDVSHGKLSFLELLRKPAIEPFFKLGSTGRFDDVKYTVIAFLVRSCTVDTIRYPWEEYLLFNPQAGFRWLMRSDNHWTLLTPIPMGQVSFDGLNAIFKGQKYRSFQNVQAVTESVLGECYWRVSVGERASASEYVAPPFSLNFDETAKEITATQGRMLSAKELQEAFSLREPPPGAFGVAPAQVNPFQEKAATLWKWTALWALALGALVLVFAVISNTSQFMQQTFSVPAGASSAAAEAQVFSEPFTVPDNIPVAIEVTAPNLEDNWLGVSVDLVHEESGEVVSVYAETSAYSGFEDGERWSEGSRSATLRTDALKGGSYVLRATPSFDGAKTPPPYTVTVRGDNGPGFCIPCCFWLLLLLPAVITQLRSSNFEKRRWENSNLVDRTKLQWTNDVDDGSESFTS
jgi:Domain of unknown function (DUF4178)